MSKAKLEASRPGKGAKSEHISWHQHLLQYFIAHLSAFKISLRNITLTPLSTLMTVLAIGLCLSLPMSIFLFVKNLQHWSQGWHESAAISLYIEPQSTPQQIRVILDKIKEYPFVESTTLISPQQALEEFQLASGLKDTLALLPENPLPGVINIQLNTNQFSDQNEFKSMKESLAKLPQVKLANFDFEWISRLNGFLSVGKLLAQLLFLIIGLGVVLMVGNTIRLTLERHRDEIEVLNMIGATLGFIRRPFLYRGMLYGVLGGIVAALVINLAIFALQTPIQQLSLLFEGVLSLRNLPLNDTLFLLITSTMLGWLGAAIAFTQQAHGLTIENT